MFGCHEHGRVGTLRSSHNSNFGPKTQSFFCHYNRLNASDLANAANRIEQGPIDHSEHPTGTVGHPAQMDEVQQHLKAQYNQ